MIQDNGSKMAPLTIALMDLFSILKENLLIFLCSVQVWLRLVVI